MALCPICEHELPESSVGRCPNCGADVVEVAPAPEPARASGEGTPWDERARIGILAALVETTRQVLTGPTAFFRAMPVGSGLGSPLLYGAILGWLGAAASGFYQALFQSIVGTSLAEALLRFASPAAVPYDSALSGVLEGWGGFVAQLVFGGVIAAIGVLLTAGVLHLVLLLLGGARRGFEATVRVVSYSQAVGILFLLPFCGQLAGSLWALVLYVIGIAETHRSGYGKALGAVLLPLVVLCCCCGVVLGLVILGAAGLAAQLR